MQRGNDNELNQNHAANFQFTLLTLTKLLILYNVQNLFLEKTWKILLQLGMTHLSPFPYTHSMFHN